jgi:peptidoglycan/xylan/chitin deacetylase (PgdA/CDA1 family)
MGILMPVLIGLSFLGSALTVLPTAVVEWARHRSPEVLFRVNTAEPVVALSIDDGPSSATPEILDVLAKEGVKATFFLIGSHVRDHPDVARRLVSEGHEIGHHMMQDRPSVSLSPQEFRESFAEMDRILGELGGSVLFRPGSGWYNQRMVDEAARRGYRTVLGSVYPFDAQLPFPDLASWYVLQHLTSGDIVVLHDGPERGPRTVEVLRQVLPELRRRGFRVVSVSTLLDLAEREAATGLMTETPTARPGS